MDKEDREAIEEVIHQYLSGWRKLDAQTLKGIWNQAYSQLTCKPAELEQPLTDWQGIEKYYHDVTTSIEIKEFRASDPVIDIFGSVACASLKTFFLAVMKNSREKIEAEGRVSFILHKKRGKWSVIN
jgi:hypothetical protein